MRRGSNDSPQNLNLSAAHRDRTQFASDNVQVISKRTKSLSVAAENQYRWEIFHFHHTPETRWKNGELTDAP